MSVRLTFSNPFRLLSDQSFSSFVKVTAISDRYPHFADLARDGDDSCRSGLSFDACILYSRNLRVLRDRHRVGPKLSG